ncbi:MAG: glycosyltransferase family 2 protein [Acidobacteriota bacterium]
MNRAGAAEVVTLPALPFVSVVMPVRNEGEFIARSVGSVLAQDFPAERMEVLVADGLSDDGTAQAVEDFARADPRVRLVPNPGRIVATGLNAAIAIARGDILVRVDGHCEIAPDYVARCVEHLQRGEAEGVGGPLETVGENPRSQTIALAMSSRFGVGGASFRTGSGLDRLVDTVAFPAYTRDVVRRAGPYDEELVRDQDDEYNYRLRNMGFRILLAGDVRSRYYSRSSIRSLGRQYFQYGFWKVRVMQKHPRQMRPRQFVPPLFAASLIGAAVAAPLGRRTWIPFAAVAGAYTAANLAASAWTARRAAGPGRLLLPVAFATLHLSYGLGFLTGLLRFAGRWKDRTGRGDFAPSAGGRALRPPPLGTPEKKIP